MLHVLITYCIYLAGIVFICVQAVRYLFCQELFNVPNNCHMVKEEKVE